jgi:hypothetical protein
MWKYVPGDKYSLEQLEAFERFFLDDENRALISVLNAKRYEKYGLPGWRTEILRRQMAVDEATKNLIIVRAALLWAKDNSG